MTSLADFRAPLIDGTDRSLSDYLGSVVLVVNTASQCGFTPQFEGLQQLQDQYGDQGLTVLGFPCNQFASQDPGTDEEIGEFCSRNYGVSFPMFSRVDVNGEDAHPLFEWLRTEKGGLLGSRIKWNFTKFLIGRDGQVVRRYGSTTAPARIADDIEQQLAT